MKTSVVTSIKQTVREWFGQLSVEEIISNRNLSHIFENIETLLARMEEASTKGLRYEKCSC